MARRRQSRADAAADELIAFLERVPAWVGPVLALVVYVALRFGVPLVFGAGVEPSQRVFRDIAVELAPWGSIVVVFCWVFAQFKIINRRRLLDGQGDLSKIRDLSWREFEQLVGEAYRRQGYDVSEVGGGGADEGVDLILRRDGQTTLVQCKQWRSWTVGVKVVRELYGVMTRKRAGRGILVTCGRFTRDATEFAEGEPIDLVDGQALWRLVQDVQSEAKKSAPTTPLQARPGVVEPTIPPVQSVAQPTLAAAIPPTSSTAAPDCPKCGLPMVLRIARRGQNAGTSFFSCSRFPRCWGRMSADLDGE